MKLSAFLKKNMALEYKMLKKDFKLCQNICKEYGKSYYFATKFFPKKIRQATYALYAFFRIIKKCNQYYNCAGTFRH